MAQHPHHHHGPKQMPLLLDSNSPIIKPCAGGISFIRLFLVFSLFSCTLLVFSLCKDGATDDNEPQIPTPPPPPCSLRGMLNNTICCDRTSHRSDVCYMRGDIRTNSSASSILLHLPGGGSRLAVERIRPYTRKWESAVMSTIDELSLRTADDDAYPHHCDVRHDVPAIVFSTGGYTGNVYHEFNDGILPLYITAKRFNGRVVLVLLEYHDWWISKYADVLSRISHFQPLDFSSPDRRTHCFPQAIVGLRIHGELSVDAESSSSGESILDFRRLLDDAYRPRIDGLDREEKLLEPELQHQRPKLVIVSRNGSRAIENEGELAAAAADEGFRVEVLRPKRTTELAKIYRALNSSDAMVGVHGAAMTHFLFMRPATAFVQIVPLGTDWAAEAYYGEPARKMGLRYTAYRIRPAESSLSRRYRRDDPVLRDPDSVNANGWDVTKRVYLDGQNVRLDLRRFRKRLASVHRYLLSRQANSS